MSGIIVPAPDKFSAQSKWTQQIHRGCGGEIVIIVQVENKRMAACCKGCRDIWYMPDIDGWPENWETPGRVPERLILPPSGRVI